MRLEGVQVYSFYPGKSVRVKLYPKVDLICASNLSVSADIYLYIIYVPIKLVIPS